MIADITHANDLDQSCAEQAASTRTAEIVPWWQEVARLFRAYSDRQIRQEVPYALTGDDVAIAFLGIRGGHAPPSRRFKRVVYRSRLLCGASRAAGDASSAAPEKNTEQSVSPSPADPDRATLRDDFRQVALFETMRPEVMWARLYLRRLIIRHRNESPFQRRRLTIKYRLSDCDVPEIYNEAETAPLLAMGVAGLISRELDEVSGLLRAEQAVEFALTASCAQPEPLGRPVLTVLEQRLSEEITPLNFHLQLDGKLGRFDYV